MLLVTTDVLKNEFPAIDSGHGGHISTHAVLKVRQEGTTPDQPHSRLALRQIACSFRVNNPRKTQNQNYKSRTRMGALPAKMRFGPMNLGPIVSWRNNSTQY